MNNFKRAKTSVLRQLGKFMLLLVITFILSTLSSGAVSVNRAISNTEAHLRQQMRPLIRFRPDEFAREEAWEEAGGYWGEEEINGRVWGVAQGPEWPTRYPITIDMIHNIAALPQVAEYHYSTRTHFITSFNEYLPDGLIPDGGSGFHCFSSPDAALTEMTTPPYFGCFPESIIHDPVTIFINGTSTNEPLEMREGLIELVAGHNLGEISLSGQLFPIIVSTGFAQANGLDIGSEINFTSIITSREPVATWEEMVVDEQTFEFTIIGMFDVVPQVAENDQFELQRQRNIANQMFTTNDANAAIQHFEIEGEKRVARDALEESWINDRISGFGTVVTLLLNDPRELESFSEEVKAYIPDFWEPVNLVNSFDTIATSMSNLNDIANGILIGAALATVLILSLLIMLFLKDRRHEIGIYLALGEKRAKIIHQLLIEVLTVIFIGISLSIFSGHILSSSLSQEMIRMEISHDNENQTSQLVNPWEIELEDLGFGGYLSVDEMIDIFDTSLDATTILLLYGIGITTSIIATLIPILYIVRLKPKKVLL